MKNKGLIVILIIIITPIISGFYGVLHDQITYSISTEYYTKFKFAQFNIPIKDLYSERIGVGIVGFLATWWVGIPIGFLLATIGYQRIDFDSFLKLKLQSILVVFLTTILIGIIGYLLGNSRFDYLQSNDMMMNVGGYSSNAEKFQSIYDIKDIRNFMIVGTIHNFSYLGGAIGTILGIVFQLIKSRKVK